MSKIEEKEQEQEQQPVSKTSIPSYQAHPRDAYDKRFVVQFDLGYQPSKGKTMDPEGETVPDMSLTVRQLLVNHTRDANTGNVVAADPIWFDTEVPNLKDLTDLDRYREELLERAEQVQQFINKDKNDAEDRRKADAAAAAEAAAKEAVQQEEQQPGAPSVQPDNLR